MSSPTFEHELPLWDQNFAVIGIDEVGRGCLAGPVTVSGVCFLPANETDIFRFQTLGINDSKKLSPAKRRHIHDLLVIEKLQYATASSSVEEINTYGIVRALNKSILQVIQDLSQKLPQKRIFVLLDGLNHPDTASLQNILYRNIIRGDSLSLSIAAASIIAKVTRDTYMETLSRKFPNYIWEKNKGYGTADHREAIKLHGPCTHHRTLFIRNCV